MKTPKRHFEIEWPLLQRQSKSGRFCQIFVAFLENMHVNFYSHTIWEDISSLHLKDRVFKNKKILADKSLILASKTLWLFYETSLEEHSLFAWLDTYLPSLGTYLVLVVQFSHVDFLLRIYLSRICLSQHKLTMGKIKDQPISIYLDLKPHLVLVVQFSHVVHITIEFINNPHFIFWKFPRYLVSGLLDILM